MSKRNKLPLHFRWTSQTAGIEDLNYYGHTHTIMYLASTDSILAEHAVAINVQVDAHGNASIVHDIFSSSLILTYSKNCIQNFH